MYALAQDSAEVKGLTLHTDTALEQLRELQRHVGQLADQDLQVRARARAARVRWLAVVTMILWLAILILLLARL